MRLQINITNTFASDIYQKETIVVNLEIIICITCHKIIRDYFKDIYHE